MAENLSTTQTSKGRYMNNNKENKNDPKMLEEELCLLYSRKKHLTATQLKMSNVSKRRWLRQGSKYWLLHSERDKIIQTLFFFFSSEMTASKNSEKQHLREIPI